MIEMDTSDLIVSTDPKIDGSMNGKTSLNEIVLSIENEEISITSDQSIYSVKRGYVATVVDTIYERIDDTDSVSFVIEFAEDSSTGIFSPKAFQDMLTDTCYLSC